MKQAVKKQNKITSRFIDNKDGTITDSKTGFIWVKNPHTDLPEKFKSEMKYQQAIDACKELNFAGHKDWRLPTIEELRELVDYIRRQPAIDTSIFPDTICNWYWTSTTYAVYTDLAWGVDFDSGYVSNGYKTYTYYVRPVRGG